MKIDKKQLLTNFLFFLESFETEGYGKCAFELLDGTNYQGWIMDIQDTTITWLDSGPLSEMDPLLVDLEKINENTLYYFDVVSYKWLKFEV